MKQEELKLRKMCFTLVVRNLPTHLFLNPGITPGVCLVCGLCVSGVSNLNQ